MKIVRIGFDFTVTMPIVPQLIFYKGPLFISARSRKLCIWLVCYRSKHIKDILRTLCWGIKAVEIQVNGKIKMSRSLILMALDDHKWLIVRKLTTMINTYFIAQCPLLCDNQRLQYSIDFINLSYLQFNLYTFTWTIISKPSYFTSFILFFY